MGGMLPAGLSLPSNRPLTFEWTWLEGRAVAFDWGSSDRMQMVGIAPALAMACLSQWLPSQMCLRFGMLGHTHPVVLVESHLQLPSSRVGALED